MTEQNSAIQRKLFESLQSLIPSNYTLVDILAELLGISTDSVYRRIRCETLLNINEISLICSRFNLSFDSVCSSAINGSVTFKYSSLYTEQEYIEYLKSIYSDIKQLSEAENKYAIYAAEDIPLFHYFRDPEITAFKIFYWLRSVVSDEKYLQVKFDKNLISKEIIDICQEIFKCYSLTPSSEIWTNVTATSLLLQIRYFWESGLFNNKEQALYVCSLAEEEINFVEKQAEFGRKLDSNLNPVLGEGSFVLYHSDIEIGNNTIFVNRDGYKVLYLTHNTMNKIVTVNQDFCNETEIWLKNLIKKSTILSGVAEKQRHRFFQSIRQELNSIKQMIETESM
jgi:hypothetical protein